MKQIYSCIPSTGRDEIHTHWMFTWKTIWEIYNLNSHSADVWSPRRKGILPGLRHSDECHSVDIWVTSSPWKTLRDSPYIPNQWTLYRRRWRKALVRSTIKNTLGEISRQRELLKRIYGCVPSAQHDSTLLTSKRNKHRDHVVPWDTGNLKNASICDYK